MSPKIAERLEERVQELSQRLNEVQLILTARKNPDYVRMAKASLDPEAGIDAALLAGKLQDR